MVLGLRNRLALFLVATLAIVQGLTMITLYQVARSSLIATGKQQLSQSAAAFDHHLDTLTAHLAEDGKIMSLDYALRQAVASGDTGTAISALRNFGHRVGASRMMLIQLDGTIAADTLHPDRTGHLGAFPFPRLIQNVSRQSLAPGTAIVDGIPYLFGPGL